MPFKIDFNIVNYKGILPDYKEYLKNDIIINDREFSKGNIDECVWKKKILTADEIKSSEIREREARRMLKTGVWIAIKDEILWIPPNYYFGLQYSKVGEVDWQFRLKRLKNVYEKIRARLNPNCKGTLVIKNRADGETTSSITDGLWECADGNMFVGQIGIQSKTRSDAINPCWSTAQIAWQSLPQWVIDDLFSDISNPDNMAEKIKFTRSSSESENKAARHIIMQYYPCVFNAMDGKHNMKKCILDEICKWVECEFYDTYTNYSQFIMPGFERRGLFDMFSSPADVPTKSNEQVFNLWKDSDTKEFTEFGTTRSRIHRIYSNPLEGIQGAYDKWGDADGEQIYKWIMDKRKNTPKDKLQGEIRAFPLNEQEMFDSPDAGHIWDNHKGINSRKIYLIGTRFKDDIKKEPKVLYGNYEWKDGIKDTDVIFRPADKLEFDEHDARACISYLLPERPPLSLIKHPPKIVSNCIGIDSVDKRYAGKSPSNFAMVNNKFLDFENSGVINCPTMIYCSRPLPIEIAYEDAIKAAVYHRAMVQVESLNSKIVDYFEDRGYLEWMISKIGQPKNSLMKGDAPHHKTAFLQEMISLLNAATNVPVNEGDKYLLDRHWFYELLDDLSNFNDKDTHKNDLSVAYGQSLIGTAKLLFKKVKQKSKYADQIFDYMYN